MQTDKNSDSEEAGSRHSVNDAHPERMPTVGWRQINDFSCHPPQINFAPEESLVLRGTYVRQEKLVLRTDAEVLLVERDKLNEKLSGFVQTALSAFERAVVMLEKMQEDQDLHHSKTEMYEKLEEVAAALRVTLVSSTTRAALSLAPDDGAPRKTTAFGP
jgi:hypothetical protein